MLSYFYIHNIILVFIGIACCLYIINIDLLYNLMVSLKKYLASEKEIKIEEKNIMFDRHEINQIDMNTIDSHLTLAETIEELGFIPSLEKNDDINAA